MEPLVSIVIPVYNAGAHLARCIESVRRQTWQNLQVVLVNDGSTDASAEVCRMYARVDGRIHLIDKPNAGVSAARNDGLAAAKGEYIQFVDSDDYLPEDATQLLVDRARETGCDLVIGAYFRVVEGAVPGPHGDGGTRYTLHGFLPRGPVMDKTAFAKTHHVLDLIQNRGRTIRMDADNQKPEGVAAQIDDADAPFRPRRYPA